MSQNALNKVGGVVRNISIKFVQLTPIYIIAFILWGDSFLPQPLDRFSYNTRTSINNFLVASFNLEKLENDKYNHEKNKKLIQEIERNN